MEFPGYRTPVFSPISWIDAKFCFEILYQEMARDSLSCLNVTFRKMPSASIYPYVKFEYQVIIKYSDGTPDKSYTSPAELSLVDWSSKECFREVSKNSGCFVQPLSGTDKRRGEKMESDTLILKCRMKISGHLLACKTYNEKMKFLNNLSKFAGNFYSLFSSTTFSDLVIQVGQKTIPAHKCVLATHSPVFKKMLEQDFLESKTNTVVISDFEPEIIESFLKFLYSADIEDKSFSNLKQLYVLADKYDVQILKQECVRIITQCFFTAEHIYEVFRLAFQFNDGDLKKAAKVYAAEHIQEIITSADWRDLLTSFPISCYEIVASNYLPLDVSYSDKVTEEDEVTSENEEKKRKKVKTSHQQDID